MAKLKLTIATPERVVLDDEVDQVTIPTSQGEITVLPNHIPLIAELAAGDIVAQKDADQIPMAVVGGFIQIRGKNHIVILADFAEHVAEMTDEEIAKAKARAEELRKERQSASTEEYEYFASELEKSLIRAKVAGKWSGKKYRDYKKQNLKT